MVHVPAIYLKNFLEENLKYNTLQILEHIMVLIDDEDVIKKQLYKIQGNFNLHCITICKLILLYIKSRAPHSPFFCR